MRFLPTLWPLSNENFIEGNLSRDTFTFRLGFVVWVGHFMVLTTKCRFDMGGGTGKQGVWGLAPETFFRVTSSRTSESAPCQIMLFVFIIEIYAK